MRSIGFSTGAIAKDYFKKAVEISRLQKLDAIELSALRKEELPGIVDWLKHPTPAGFSYLSIHAPSRYAPDEEAAIANSLLPAIENGYRVVIHPDAVCQPARWRAFGKWLCIENMDKRKPVGRTATELRKIFSKLPEASFCFDIGHARQVDPTMSAAGEMLREFRGRLAQLHVSDVNSSSQHERLNWCASESFAKVADLVPAETPWILETPMNAADSSADRSIQKEIAKAQSALARLDNWRMVATTIDKKKAQSSDWPQFVREQLTQPEKMVLILMCCQKVDKKTISTNLGVPADEIDSLLESVRRRFELITGGDKPPTRIPGFTKAAI